MGDTGIRSSPTRYFVLSAMVIHELRWHETLESLITFRKHLRDTKGLKLREEIHASHFVNNPGSLVRIKRHDRLDIMKQCVDWVASQSGMNILSVVVDKSHHSQDVFEYAWEVLLQRFENTLNYRNFAGPMNADERGIVISDNTDGKKLQGVIRKMRRYNPVPNIRSLYTGGSRNLRVQHVIEDVMMKDSATSYFHQIVDVVVYCARQLYEPNAYMRTKGGHQFYKRLDRVLIKQASKTHPLGIVEI
ncbi:MAG: DUF3800 domain-containing protein [Ignavibacteria bacterium]|nr:DUF3800 domain-containing protein [Ignavibacteria bacterium]